MTTTAKAVVGGVLIIGGVVAYLMLAGGQSPIEIADSSVKLHYEYNFDVKGNNKIQAAKLFRHVESINVVGTNESIPLKKKGWTLSSYNSKLKISPDEYILETDVPIETVDNSPITQVNANSLQDFLYDPSDQSKFTPAKLTFADGKCPQECKSCSAGTCTLTCAGGSTDKCTIQIQFK